ncbi:uncharacterized protein LOC123508107 [Portunus trituberculatus]|uniref:uncharacterized protein LOC123508107 n=1 Tax=Portunus trituberculatus TaxID=210409 RepID=UPI001E1CD37F|nr:uncharacterized protein LOC123508107 [Portunus trituberculatus]XP_045117535.1 uncharacterized protein LOC123508107 [Portunus trituberculatus]XP_045117542.1 uncharacterized protein LOC123508107 [Portunus trituberculatus]
MDAVTQGVYDILGSDSVALFGIPEGTDSNLDCLRLIVESGNLEAVQVTAPSDMSQDEIAATMRDTTISAVSPTHAATSPTHAATSPTPPATSPTPPTASGTLPAASSATLAAASAAETGQQKKKKIILY